MIPTSASINAITEVAQERIRALRLAPRSLHAIAVLCMLGRVADEMGTGLLWSRFQRVNELMLPSQNEEREAGKIVLAATQDVRALCVGDDVVTETFRRLLDQIEDGLLFFPSKLDRLSRLINPMESYSPLGEARQTKSRRYDVKKTDAEPKRCAVVPMQRTSGGAM